jgi:hypothetical protein
MSKRRAINDRELKQADEFAEEFDRLLASGGSVEERVKKVLDTVLAAPVRQLLDTVRAECDPARPGRRDIIEQTEGILATAEASVADLAARPDGIAKSLREMIQARDAEAGRQ